ncbi:MAG: hypothetical protein ABSD78_12565 [Acidimicrobiales bacterium]|jgi:hypothetical protein
MAELRELRFYLAGWPTRITYWLASAGERVVDVQPRRHPHAQPDG